MTQDLLDTVEQEEMFRQKSKDNSGRLFNTVGSHGANPEKMGQILATWDLVMEILGFQFRPIAKLSHFVTQYQASIDAHYHSDYKEILIAEEQERRRSERKGTQLSILQQ